MNNFIKNKGKPSRGTTTTTTAAAVEEDELALVKSAAWAWYEHGSGSGSEGRPIREFDASRTKTDPKPSRYKLEALRNNNNNVRQVPKLRSSSSGNNSLLDHYEVERISKQLDYYIESSRAKYRRSFSAAGNGGLAVEPVAAAAEMKSINKVVGRKKAGKESRLKHIPVACRSSRGDVVESHRKFVYSRPERGGVVAVVEVGSCRPRAWSARA
ncbi:hypothetical protein ABFS82_11G101800 [Erythranthe guttata]|uniref:Uncharacterized protein n=1 Tax=Erythranthe guttata TaxID=4155 RepID=A0A022S0J6_ERYGU|nr:PREDICTED: uncharacterized protein LOC105959414 [Erythranthe guttata]EYU45781.1 hypothetical protein MIMGU_mgv1a020436mg [Erythranthe guttata]|eukprot:XP_012838973.1 PREDICTED: uncharacterized protein LOC105959414 [Erythranthe guttata]